MRFPCLASCRHLSLTAWAVAALIAVIAATPASAAVPLPGDLAYGAKYHLVFNSTSGIEGTSGNIAVYNQLVQNAASAANIGTSAGVTWKAIVSTTSVNARDNAVVGAATPVYNMNLDRVANNFADFWDGTLAATVGYDETGSGNPVPAWTGSTSSGVGAAGLTLGASPAGFARAGSPVFTSALWIAANDPSTASFLSVYALSQELTVAPGDFDGDHDTDGNDVLRWQRGLGTTRTAADLTLIKDNFGSAAGSIQAIPEPGTLVLGVVGAALGLRRRRRK